MAVIIRSVYDEHEHEQGFVSIHPSMTKQEFAAEADINVLMARYNDMEYPLIDPMVQRSGEPMFGDFSEIPNLQEAQNKLIEAEQMFMQLPSKIRQKFDNDPIAFVDYCQKEENVGEMRELGILPKLYYNEDGQEYYFRDGFPVYTGNKKDMQVQASEPAV